MSKLEVDAIDKQSGSTLTLGGSGTAVTLASGSTQTGFGRTGAVDWQTASIKTATFTAASGEGYFCNTAGGTFEVDLPAGVAGAIVSIQDYNNTFDSNSLTVDPNGSEKINGGTAGGFITLSTEGLGITFVYIDATVGWRSVDSNEYSTLGSIPTFICASVSGTGNTLATVDTNFKVATFTGPGTFTVNSVGNPAGSNEVSYTVVAGGGAGANAMAALNGFGGGGGAGGFREGKSPQDSYTSSPIACTSGSNNGIPVTAQGYAIAIGAGGAGRLNSAPGCGNRGSVSSALGILSTGGGGGMYDGGNPSAPGGSGGGVGVCVVAVGSGNTPPVSPAQGTNGGTVSPPPQNSGGGGGGATVVGSNGTTGGPAGPGGAGATTSINGTPTAFAGGGGGGGNQGETGGGAGGTGGGGAGGNFPSSPGTPGTTNTGGGGGSTSSAPATLTAGNGGSGIVIIRYKFQ